MQVMSEEQSCLQELGFLHYLRRAGVPVAEYSFPSSKIAAWRIYATDVLLSRLS